METCRRKKLLEALENIYNACPDSGSAIVVRCEKRYLEDYMMEKHPDAKRVYAYPTVCPYDEHRELSDYCDGNCHKCWNKRMTIKKKEIENCLEHSKAYLEDCLNKYPGVNPQVALYKSLTENEDEEECEND